MNQRLVWERDGRHWPHRDASRFVLAAHLRWHVQAMEPKLQVAPRARHAPVVWLLHGTGAATHSWRGLMPLLARSCRVVAADLPGHGFTDMPDGAANSEQFSLPGMAHALQTLMGALELAPDLVVGHSAGAALALRMCLDGQIAPNALVSLNGALLPPGGLAGQFFSPVAKLMAAAPFVPRLFAWHASEPAVLERLIAATGSALDPGGQALYAQLIRNPGHAAGALAMMANWDLPALARDLPRLQTPLCLAVGSKDRTIAPAQAQQVLALLPRHPLTTLTTFAGLGHLAHEERPDLAAQLVLRVAQDAGLLGDLASR